jgi:hypothetical protein
MYRKTIQTIMITMFFCYGLIAELNWWSPREIPLLKGNVNQYSIAINEKGKAIALIGDRFLGDYDVQTKEWKIVKLNLDSENITFTSITQENDIAYETDSEVAKGQRVALNDNHQGYAVFRVAEGPHIGKIAVACYKENTWQEVVVLSEEAGYMPVVAQSSYGLAMVAWINQEKHSPDEQGVMSAYGEGSEWHKQGVISQYKSIPFDHHQSPLHIKISEVNDVMIVWKTSYSNQEASLEPSIAVACFDGIEEKWVSEELLASQPQNKREIHVAMDTQGNSFVVWDTDKGIEGAFINLTQHLLKSVYQGEPLPHGEWSKHILAEGPDLIMPKVAVTSEGNGVVIWGNGYQGMESAYFDSQNMTWNKISPGLSSKTIYSNNIEGHNEGVHVWWIGEEDASQEEMLTAYFDEHGKTWKNIKVLSSTQTSDVLIDGVEGVSLGKQHFGMIVWYDFYKEKLFYSLLTQEQEPFRWKDRKNNKLYLKKMEFTKRRLERKAKVSR